MSESSTKLLSIEGLSKTYIGRRSLIERLMGTPVTNCQAVNGVSFDIHRGETLGLIGESGCGKSTLGRSILRLHEPTSGSVRYDNQDVIGLSPAEMKQMRRQMQIIFQDPYASLNPRRSVVELVGLPLKLHGLAKTDDEIREKVTDIIERVGLKANQLDRYPHQFSGGQRQRIGIARALISNPEFIVCDEPVSALDVSIQAQIIKLLQELKQEMNLTYLFISHDISVIGYLSDRVAVMYLGELVELGPVDSVLSNPRHPYTQSLMSAAPDVDQPGKRERVQLKGDLPSPMNPPSGCKFHTRCPVAIDRCQTEVPQTENLGPGHQAKCHRTYEHINILDLT